MEYESYGSALYEEPSAHVYEDHVSELETVDDDSKYDRFRWDRYDWSHFDPEEYGYAVIRLGANEFSKRRRSIHSGVYFSMVDPCYLEGLIENDQRWYPLVEYYRDPERGGEYAEPLTIKRIVAHRNTGPRESRQLVYLHRLICGVEGILFADHVNGLPLDNRSCNLRPAGRTLNGYNAQRIRTTNKMLLPGVEWRSNDRRTMVGGVIKINGLTIRSETAWPIAEQEEARRWYTEKRVELFGGDWVNGHAPRDIPRFPPLKRQSQLPACDSSGEEIPF